MSNRALSWAFDLEGLKSGPKFVLVALADYADERASCFPSVPHLAKRTGFGQTAVRAHLDKLQELGLITEERRHRSNGTRTSNRYTLNLEPESEGY